MSGMMTKFGPCIDGNHDKCQSEFIWNGVPKVCTCDCHRSGK